MTRISILLFVLQFAVYGWSANLPSPIRAIAATAAQKQNGVSIRTVANQATALSPTTSDQSCSSTNYKAAKSVEIGSYSTNFLFELLTVVATIFIAIFNGLLWFSTKKLWIESRRASVIAAKAAWSSTKSANVAEKHMTVGERAFISATGMSSYYFPRDDGGYNWTLRPQWLNSGNTPTKALTIFVDYKISDVEITPDSKSINSAAPAPARAHLAPRSGMQGGIVPREPDTLTPDLIEEIKVGKTKFMYMWGWVKYHDVFEGAEEHTTRFCWRIVPVGYPKTFRPNAVDITQTLRFDYIQVGEDNCADDE